MSERDRLLLTGTREQDRINPYQRYVQLRMRAGRVITHYWARTIAVLHGREFFAEFLATFMLIVSMFVEASFPCPRLLWSIEMTRRHCDL